MKAVTQTAYGGPEVYSLIDLPRPTPKPQEILIANHASAASTAEAIMRTGHPLIARLFTGLFRPTAPVAGDSFAGTVTQVGSEVRDFREGDQVMGLLFGSDSSSQGAWASHLAVHQDAVLAPLPAGLEPAPAVSLMEGFLTALPFLRDHAQLQTGQRILINGASGAIGTVAVQLAKMMGADVTGVCSGRNIDLVAGLGADRVVNYETTDFTQSDHPYDVVFDVAGKSSLSASKRVLFDGGIYMTTVPGWGIAAAMLLGSRRWKRRAILATTGLRKPAQKRHDLRLLAQWVEAGHLRPVVGHRFALDQIEAANRLIDDGRKTASVVIDIAA